MTCRASIRSRAPKASSPKIRATMRAVGSSDTAPERSLRSALFRTGLRFRKEQPLLREQRWKADILFPGVNLCIFVDGCFWHGCPIHYRCPKSNSSWWHEKITDNQRRDRHVGKVLRSAGWTVVRVWEHEIVADAEACAKRVCRVYERLDRARGKGS